MQEQEQSANTMQRAIVSTDQGVQENKSLQRAAAREEPGVREQEQSANTMRRAIARDEPGVLEHESEQRAAAREDPAVRARESRQQAVAQGKKTHEMACKCVNGEYLFHKPCGLWNEPCVHGCGYIHLSNSTPGTRKKCCVNGGRAVAARRWQRSSGSVAVVAVRRQRGGGQHGGSVGQCGSSAVAGSVTAVLAMQRRRR